MHDTSPLTTAKENHVSEDRQDSVSDHRLIENGKFKFEIFMIFLIICAAVGERNLLAILLVLAWIVMELKGIRRALERSSER